MYDTIVIIGIIMKSFSHTLAIILLLGFVLRITVSLWSFQFRENTDVLRYRDWAKISYLHGMSETYKPTYLEFGTLPNNQPPGSLYIISSMYYANIQLSKVILKITDAKEGSLQWINSAFINMILRLPSIGADLVLGFLIYKLVLSFKSQKNALLASSLFLFNPAVIYNSSFWGQMDSLNNLFFFLSLFSLVKKRIFLSIIFFVLSLYIKLSLVFLVPIVGYYWIQMYKPKYKKLFLSLATGAAIIFILTLPISSTPHNWLWTYLTQNSLGEMQHITNFAFNGWWFLFMPFISIGKTTDVFSFSEISLHNSPLSSEIFWGLPLTTWSLVIFGILSLIIFYKVIKNSWKKLLPEQIFLSCSIVILIAFLFLPRMHERYLYPLFAVLSTYIGLTNRFVWVYILLSILNLVNLYLVWHPFLPPVIPYEFMNSKIFQWIISGIVTISGMTFYIRSLKLLKK